MQDLPEPPLIRTSMGSAFDKQIGGDHYKKLAVQPFEFIELNHLGFSAGNVIKYLCRYKIKGGLEDLKKARHYLDLLIELETDVEVLGDALIAINEETKPCTTGEQHD